MASLRHGFAGAETDLAGGMAAAVAMGCPPGAAAPLLAAFSAGIAAGQAKRDKGNDDDHGDG